MLALLSNGLIGNALGVAGVVLAVWFYLKARQFPELSMYVRREQLIGSAAAQMAGTLDVVFNGREVKSLARMELTVWNSGNISFRKSDVVASDPPAISIGAKSRILDVSKLRESSSSTSCQAAIAASQDKLTFSWEYLNPGDGCAWVIICEGDINEACSVSGVVVGLPAGARLTTIKPRATRSNLELVAVIFLAVMALLALIEIALDFPYARWEDSITVLSVETKRWITASAMLLMSGVPALLLWLKTRPNAPRALESD